MKKNPKKESQDQKDSHVDIIIKDQKVKKMIKNYYKSLLINGRKMHLLDLQEMF